VERNGIRHGFAPNEGIERGKERHPSWIRDHPVSVWAPQASTICGHSQAQFGSTGMFAPHQRRVPNSRFGCLELISEHPTHVIASLTTVEDKRRAGANMAFDRFAAHVNANRGQTGLPENPGDGPVLAEVLRETFAYYRGRSYELGDIITAFQFGHTRATVTANYQRYRPGDKWNNAFRDGQVDAEVALLDSVARFTGEEGPVVGRHSDELRADALELRATILADREAARRLAADHAETWHHGEILSCRFDRSTAVCHKLAAAAGVTDPGDRPLHDLCVGSGCVNVHFTRRNLAPLKGQRADIAARLTSAPSGSVAHLQAQEELDRVDQTIAQLQAPFHRQD
jgi:hypothetical protein